MERVTICSKATSKTGKDLNSRIEMKSGAYWINGKQLDNELPASKKLDGMHFSIEMETGTSKTYVYLRTIYEINKLYGFKKFVIVVPSVSIREGVLKNLEITHEYFQNLYDNVSINFQVYDSTKVSTLRGFASTDFAPCAILLLIENNTTFPIASIP